MATRHRIPTIFNLSMVDVLCCALGCVILLWLVNLREAKQRAQAAGQTSAMLTRTQSQLEETSQRADATEQERAAARARLADLEKELAALRLQAADTEDQLAKKTQEQLDLARQLTAARQRVDTLDVLVREKEAQARTTARALDEQAERLRDLDARLKQARAQADLVPGLRAEADATRKKLALAEAEQAALQKDVQARTKDLAGASKTLQGLEEANRRLEGEVATLTKRLADMGRDLGSLQTEKRVLSEKAARAQAAAENRFAGIELTGRRVVFLVDMSGSMELLDENTEAPDKWAGVRQTLAKVMRSLPDLEKFQVILFSNRVSYLLGQENRWLDYDPVTSTGKVAEALAAVKPKGNTDMYAAFEAAFRFRLAGLDTIYVFSDGLPNIGVPLSPVDVQRMKETERAEILSKYIRRKLQQEWNPKSAGRARVRINTIGFFYESPDVGAFLWALARENDGSFVGMSKP